jgi:hypothetical protein
MSTLDRVLDLPWYVKCPLFGIYALSLFTAYFNGTCESDGCIGVFIPLLATNALAAIQIVIVVPVYAYSRARREPGALSLSRLFAASVLPPLVVFILVNTR